MPRWGNATWTNSWADEEEGTTSREPSDCSLRYRQNRLGQYSIMRLTIFGRQVWIVAGDIILLSLRDFQDDRADVIHKYTADEARNLKTYGELKSDFTIHEAAQGDGGECIGC